MSVVIKPIVDGSQYEINGKDIYKDTNGNWVTRQELTSQELNAFNNYKKAIIENENIKIHRVATY
ncbi:hypothetical protein [Flavobacterium sp.]|uniref:hypothetical protein n=1 Tax=Flavobacterium sp. TaxID=239 RepID=UPI00375003E6